MDIKLPDTLAAEMRARAEDQGREPEAYVVGLLWRAVVELNPPTPKTGKKKKKTPVLSEVSDHDWSDVFKFGGEKEGGPTIDDLSRAVTVSGD